MDDQSDAIDTVELVGKTFEQKLVEVEFAVIQIAEKNHEQETLFQLLELKLGHGHLFEYIKHRLQGNKLGTFNNPPVAHRPKSKTVNRLHFKWYCLTRYYQLKEGITLNKALTKVRIVHDPYTNEETMRSAIKRLKRQLIPILTEALGCEPDLKTIETWCKNYKYLLPREPESR